MLKLPRGPGRRCWGNHRGLNPTRILSVTGCKSTLANWPNARLGLSGNKQTNCVAQCMGSGLANAINIQRW
eukprot:11158500-Lingulodinium_polyedra.AAC.1